MVLSISYQSVTNQSPIGHLITGQLNLSSDHFKCFCLYLFTRILFLSLFYHKKTTKSLFKLFFSGCLSKVDQQI